MSEVPSALDHFTDGLRRISGITVEDGVCGIYSHGNVTFTDGTVSGNRHCVLSNATGAVTVSDSTVSNNSSDDWGGGIFNLEGHDDHYSQHCVRQHGRLRGRRNQQRRWRVSVMDSTVSGNSSAVRS